MADDRELRDQLEKVQAEVKRLRTALAQPESLHRDVRARVDQLRRSRTQQREKLAEAGAREHELRAELEKTREENRALQGELDSIIDSEHALVDAAVQRLDPGPVRLGCFTLLLVVAVVLMGLFA